MSYKDYMKRINKRNGNLIKYHERHPKMTQEDLAKVFKVSQTRISRILKGRRIPIELIEEK